MQVVYLVDPPDGLNAKADSTVELVRAHARVGDQVFLTLRSGLYLRGDELHLLARPVQPTDDDAAWAELGAQTDRPASAYDLIALRLEPPVDSGYRLICQMLARARAAGVPVANDPGAVVLREEKLAALLHPELCPATLVSSDRNTLLDFSASLPDGCMLKPLNRMGGRGVFSFGAGDTNLPVAIDNALATGEPLLLQERLPAIRAGDRRVFVIDGKPYSHMLNRLPAPGSHLGNMAAGGQAQAMELGSEEKRIATAIGPQLKEAGIVFAGIDVIGGKLTEVNITCPTGLRTVRDQLALDPAATVVSALHQLA